MWARALIIIHLRGINPPHTLILFDDRITFVTVESPAFHFWISVPVEKAFKSKELSLWSLCTVVWIQCLSLSLDLYLYFLLIYHTSEFVVGQIRSQVESVFGDPHFTGLPHLTFNPPKRTENSYTVPQALSYASQHILMFRIILSVSAFVHLGLDNLRASEPCEFRI